MSGSSPTGPWQALILAGGRSRRMGRDKAALPWQGRPLLDHLRCMLEAEGATVTVSGRQADGRGIADLWPDAGPLGGIGSALPQLADGTVLVLPVDLPLIQARWLRPLLDAGDAAACRYAGNALPLRLRVDARLRALLPELMQGPSAQRSFNRLFDRLQGIELACPLGAGEALLNCNTPLDWQRALLSQSSIQTGDGGRSSATPIRRK